MPLSTPFAARTYAQELANVFPLALLAHLVRVPASRLMRRAECQCGGAHGQLGRPPAHATMPHRVGAAPLLDSPVKRQQRDALALDVDVAENVGTVVATPRSPQPPSAAFGGQPQGSAWPRVGERSSRERLALTDTTGKGGAVRPQTLAPQPRRMCTAAPSRLLQPRRPVIWLASASLLEACGWTPAVGGLWKVGVWCWSGRL